LNYFAPQSGKAVLEAHQKALRGTSQTLDFTWNGRTYQSTIAPLKDAANNITGAIGAAFDITERQKAEKILQQSERFNASLLLHSPNPILVFNVDSTISFVNPAFEELTGYSAGNIIGRKAPFPWWIDEDIEKATATFSLMLKKKHWKIEKQFRKKNGEKFWVEITSILVRNQNESDFLLQTWVDITEPKRLRENLEYYMMQITRMQEEERKRIAQELHEETLQSLAALCLATESIIKAGKNNPEEIKDDLNELKNRINRVIEELRHFSYGLRPGVLDYLGLMAGLETLTDDLTNSGIATSLVITGKEFPLTQDTEITIYRIVQEALSNIKKHSQAKQARVKVKYAGSKIQLTITDNGKGFRIPERLSDLANEGKLGIIGMEERARLFGGVFSIKSRRPKGTCIVISIPVHDASGKTGLRTA